MEEGHPFTYEYFKFGWPIPVVIVTRIWGCLSMASLWFEFSWPGIIGTTVFWILAIWIIDTYWPHWLPDCRYHYLCTDKEVSKEICTACQKLRGKARASENQSMEGQTQ